MNIIQLDARTDRPGTLERSLATQSRRLVMSADAAYRGRGTQTIAPGDSAAYPHALPPFAAHIDIHPPSTSGVFSRYIDRTIRRSDGAEPPSPPEATLWPVRLQWDHHSPHVPPGHVHQPDVRSAHWGRTISTLTRGPSDRRRAPSRRRGACVSKEPHRAHGEPEHGAGKHGCERGTLTPR